MGSVACPSLPPELPLLLGGYSCLFQFPHLGQEHSNFLLVPQERVKIKQTVFEKCLADGKKKKKSKYFQSSSERKPLVRLHVSNQLQQIFFFFLLWLRAYLKGKDVHISGTWSLKLRSLSRFFGFSLVFITMLPKCLKTQVPRTI